MSPRDAVAAVCNACVGVVVAAGLCVLNGAAAESQEMCYCTFVAGSISALLAVVFGPRFWRWLYARLHWFL
jgi:hypothetical protein